MIYSNLPIDLKSKFYNQSEKYSEFKFSDIESLYEFYEDREEQEQKKQNTKKVKNNNLEFNNKKLEDIENDDFSDIEVN